MLPTGKDSVCERKRSFRPASRKNLGSNSPIRWRNLHWVLVTELLALNMRSVLKLNGFRHRVLKLNGFRIGNDVTFMLNICPIRHIIS